MRGELTERLFGRIVLASVGLGFALLALAGSAAVWNVNKNQDYARWVAHSYRVSQEIAEYRVYGERAEAARRGILLTGQPRFFSAYDDAAAQLKQRIGRIDRLTADNPSQRPRVAELRRLTTLQLALFAEAIAQVRSGHRAAAAREFGFNSSPELMVVLRRVTSDMFDEEQRLLALRDRDRDASARTAFTAFALTGAIMALVGTGSLGVITRYTRDLKASHDRLRELNEGLEDAVAERTSDLARANEEIQRFAYIVSHDLRSPLVNVMGFTSELQAATGPLNDLVARAKAQAPHILTPDAEAAAALDLPEAIGFIRASTQKMDRLINAILRLSREGRRVLSPEPLDMQALLEGVTGSLKHRTDEAGVEVVVEAPAPGVVSDRVAVEQILSNLVENAVKYLQPGRPGRIVVRGHQASGRVVYEVQDNGRGIDPKDHERIFELFRRSGVQDQPGEGIGLAHVRALAYRLGGLVTCESALDQGATFRLSLPAKMAADPGLQQ